MNQVKKYIKKGKYKVDYMHIICFYCLIIKHFQQNVKKSQASLY